MEKLLETLAAPWTKRWSGQVAAAAVAFWAVGLYLVLRDIPAGRRPCQRYRPAVAAMWCRMDAVGTAGRVVLAILAVAVVVGSALVVTAATPRFIHLLAGARRPAGGPSFGRGRLTRVLVRRQLARRRRAASAGNPPATPEPGTGHSGAADHGASDRGGALQGSWRARRALRRAGHATRRRIEQDAAAAAVAARLEGAAVSALRRYPRADPAMAPTRLGCALAAMVERVAERHALDLPVCWEPFLAVLPADARTRLEQESQRVTLRGQCLIWAVAALAWTPLFEGWAEPAWPVADLAVVAMLLGGLREAFETYCDLIEALVVVHRGRLYRGLGLLPPTSTALERAAGTGGGRAVTDYLNGRHLDEDLPLCWPLTEPEQPTPPQPAPSAAGDPAGES